MNDLSNQIFLFFLPPVEHVGNSMTLAIVHVSLSLQLNHSRSWLQQSRGLEGLIFMVICNLGSIQALAKQFHTLLIGPIAAK